MGFHPKQENSVSDLEDSLASLSERIITCRRCPRLVSWREAVAEKKKRAYMDWEYWGKPVPGFGDPHARIFVVGLAPGAHGANRTGRNFTGDASGDFLYAALYRAGFANQPWSHHREDGLQLTNLYIAAAVRCAPPDNKPTPQEIAACRPYLEEEISLLRPHLQGFVALGRIAFDWLLAWYRQQGVSSNHLIFQHAAFYQPDVNLPWLLASYHPSRQNTQTGRLTPAMFDRIWELARSTLQE